MKQLVITNPKIKIWEMNFLNEIKAVYSYIIKTPYAFPKNNKGYYEAVVNKFPFLIIYEVKENTIYIGSFFHTSKNPKSKPK
jgi:hypothetical protein